MKVSILSVSLMGWAVVAVQYVYTAVYDLPGSWDLSLWDLLATTCACKYHILQIYHAITATVIDVRELMVLIV